ncbi:hypothetical protein SAMN03080615_01586 [Amphritea atlantica]|uniref:Uncharacterized protein n=1 Tax=Amphritea atlantica TaxID=355243 RepID=A0A1H9GBC1_9GAMM|nr:hypothetical protein [Amphritea atlantica]SEQ47401.1 hypothetical protein SAMN03080615_01586 [Amphritea atlantica]
MTDLKIILVHLNPISARLSFWIDCSTPQPFGCLPGGLPALTSLIEAEQPQAVTPHPARHLSQLAEYLGVDEALLQVVSPTLAWVDTAQQPVAVSLVRITTTDLPQPQANGTFISLLELLKVPVVERLLFRKAYECLLGD